MLPFWDLKDRFDSPCLYQTKHSTIGGQWSLNLLFLLLSLFFVSAIGFITIKKPPPTWEKMFGPYSIRIQLCTAGKRRLGGGKITSRSSKRMAVQKPWWKPRQTKGKHPKKYGEDGWHDGMMGWCVVEGGWYFFSCKLTLRLGRIAWIFCLNPEFGFGFTLLGTKKDHTYPPSRCVQVFVFSGFAILVGYIHSGTVWLSHGKLKSQSGGVNQKTSLLKGESRWCNFWYLVIYWSSVLSHH